MSITKGKHHPRRRKKMRYIDRTNCKSMSDKGADHEIKTMGKLTRKATKIAEENHLGLLKTHFGIYRVISESGLGAYKTDLEDLAAVDDFLKNLAAHKADRL